MIRTKIDYDIYCKATEIKEKLDEILNEMYAHDIRSFNVQEVDSTLTIVLEELQKSVY